MHVLSAPLLANTTEEKPSKGTVCVSVSTHVCWLCKYSADRSLRSPIRWFSNVPAAGPDSGAADVLCWAPHLSHKELHHQQGHPQEGAGAHGLSARLPGTMWVTRGHSRYGTTLWSFVKAHFRVGLPVCRCPTLHAEDHRTEGWVLQPLHHEKLSVRAGHQGLPQQRLTLQSHELGHYWDVWVCPCGEYFLQMSPAIVSLQVNILYNVSYASLLYSFHTQK